jgi:hypothetical protein
MVLSYLRGTILLQCRENRGRFYPTVARNYSAATLQKTGKVLTYRLHEKYSSSPGTNR